MKPGGGRTRVWHHHGSDTPTSPGAILLHSSLLGGDRNMNNTVVLLFRSKYLIQKTTLFSE